MNNDETFIPIPIALGQRIINLIQNIEIARDCTYGEGIHIIQQLQQCVYNAQNNSNKTVENSANSNGVEQKSTVNK